jgi:TolB-like protein
MGCAHLFMCRRTYWVVWVATLLRKGRDASIHSIAVLPLQNLSGDPKQDFFADGMTEELITELSRIPSLRIVSHTSVMEYKNAEAPARNRSRTFGRWHS